MVPADLERESSSQREGLFPCEQVIAWCRSQKLQLCMVVILEWQTRRILTWKALIPVSFCFLLQKSKKMHVTPHAILVLSMYKVSFFGWGRKKRGSIAKSMASLALFEDFSATQITLTLFTPEIRGNINIIYSAMRLKCSKMWLLKGETNEIWGQKEVRHPTTQ